MSALFHIAFPFTLDGRGRVASVPFDLHVRQLVTQLLLTRPGERVNRPTLGTDVQELVFAALDAAEAASAEYLVQAALQQWLGTLIQVQRVQVEDPGDLLRIAVRYTLRATGRSELLVLERERPA